MDNEELLNKIDERFQKHAEKLEEKFEKHTNELAKRTEKEFERHMGILLGQHEKEIKTVGEGHSTLLRNINEVKEEVQEHKLITEKRFDRLDIKIDSVEKKLDATIKQSDLRFKKIEEKIGH